MKNFFKKIQNDSVLSWTFWITIILIILMAIAISIAYTNIPPFIPLYNQMPWGYARLGKTYELFLLPISVLGVMIGNIIVGTRLIGKIPLLARFLFITMASLALLTFIFIIRIIFLVL